MLRVSRAEGFGSGFDGRGQGVGAELRDSVQDLSLRVCCLSASFIRPA